jgi:hypothetical protein
MLSKAQIIEGIQQINVSAARDWLENFDAPALRHYLDHLQRTLEPRGGHSIWVRSGNATAVTTREPRL